MLAYVLALVIGLGSLAIYMAAFFFPEVHRKSDFFWSAVGLFYALVLWVCAGRITGGVLLGQMASVALLGWFGWQTLTLRRSLLSPEQQTAIPNQDEVKGKLENLLPMNTFRGLLDRITGLFRKGKAEVQTAQAKLDATPQTQVEKKAESELAAAVAVPPAEATTPSSTATTRDLDATPTEEAAVTPTADATPTEEAAVTPTADATPEVTEAPDTQDTPTATIEAPATPMADDTTPSESPELVRPNPPDPELVEAAQNSDSPDMDKLRQEVESVAAIESAPPAEPPGSGDPEDRQAALEAPATIEAVPIDPENPPTAT
jgi:hypothetical protein